MLKSCVCVGGCAEKEQCSTEHMKKAFWDYRSPLKLFQFACAQVCFILSMAPQTPLHQRAAFHLNNPLADDFEVVSSFAATRAKL